MTSRIAVIDTNVVIAGLLTRRSDSPVARVLDGMLTRSFAFAVSEELLAEYAAVIERPQIRERHRLSTDETLHLLVTLARHAIVLRPVAGSAAPDPSDQFLWNLLNARADLVLVTGDRLLLEAPSPRARVLSPSAFLAAR